MAGLLERLNRWERGVARRLAVTDLTSDDNRRRARNYMLWFDHEVFRLLWSNMEQITPGVWRSNQPTAARFDRIRAAGIRTILNLRGPSQNPYYLFEQESCAAAGITLLAMPFKASRAPSTAAILDLIAHFRAMPQPFLIHCKSGADRAGLASAIYLLAIENRPLRDARAMLSTRFIHFRWFKTGVLDLILDIYAARLAKGAIGFEDWVRTEYDADAIQAEFESRPVWRRAAPPPAHLIGPFAREA